MISLDPSRRPNPHRIRRFLGVSYIFLKSRTYRADPTFTQLIPEGEVCIREVNLQVRVMHAQTTLTLSSPVSD